VHTFRTESNRSVKSSSVAERNNRRSAYGYNVWNSLACLHMTKFPHNDIQRVGEDLDSTKLERDVGESRREQPRIDSSPRTQQTASAALAGPFGASGVAWACFSHLPEDTPKRSCVIRPVCICNRVFGRWTRHEHPQPERKLTRNRPDRGVKRKGWRNHLS
jgi:hypothetical protein